MHFEGWRYELGDFTVCIGRATLKPKQEFRGFVVEIHYHPLDDISAGQAICTVWRPSAYIKSAASPLNTEILAASLNVTICGKVTFVVSHGPFAELW